MKDKKRRILYIGKAISLKNRVRSYFGKITDQNPKLESLVPQIEHIDYMVTSSELEALILENTLIKKHKPKYNVILRDDKNYPYLCLTMTEKYPRLVVTRKVQKNQNVYFGPYIPASALKKTLRSIYQLFPLRQCRALSKRDRPCLQYQMKRCGGPCAGMINLKEYQTIVQEVKLFLLGKKKTLLSSLEKQMQEAAEGLEFEKAAGIRDQVLAIRKTLQPQDVFSRQLKNKDIIHYAKADNQISMVIFFVRHGYLMGKKDFLISAPPSISDEEVLGSLVKQFYAQEVVIPRTILLGYPLTESGIIERWLSEKRGASVTLIYPQRGEGKRQVEMVRQNAHILLESHLSKTVYQDPVLRSLSEDLHLPRLPVRIEAFDISNLAGDEAVGSMVCWVDTNPVKSEYRRFKIKKVTGIDDYAMIREVIHRRYSRLLREEKNLPDLILIDGGKGHLQAGLKTLKELDISEIPVISLAKREEEIFTPYQVDPFHLSRYSTSLQLLQRIRDEAHRFAVTYHRRRRKKKLLLSNLLQIKGVGPKRQKALLSHLGSLTQIKKASREELDSVPTINSQTAQDIFEFFHPQKK